MKKINSLFIIVILLTFIPGCVNYNKGEDNFENIPFNQVSFTRGFWGELMTRVNEVSIPHILDMCEETGRIRNFRIAGGLEEGSYCTKYHFDDSDVYKAIEAASYGLRNFPDKDLEERVDSIISYIALAQENDGYIYTNRTIMGDSAHVKAGPERWINASEKSHELYNMGHLIEAGVSHYQCTGKRSLLDVAIKAADLIYDTFGYGKLEKYPGHEEIETALVRLAELTGENKYLELAGFFLDVRGPGGDEYIQAHEKVLNQYEATGHAVRAVYLYSAMTDMVRKGLRPGYRDVLDSLWADVTNRKIYITGGIGPGTGYSEGFGPSYFLPQETAYCETCSSIGNIFWNYRMFNLDPNSEYFDLIEKILYNSFLSGLSLSGDKFFYTNRLASSGQYQRKPWYPCSCCPPNIARLIESLPAYAYSKHADTLYVNLYNSSRVVIETGSGPELALQQETLYPWSGNVRIRVSTGTELFAGLRLRIPGWSSGKPQPGGLYSFLNDAGSRCTIELNGSAIDYEISKGYAVINRSWRNGDIIEIKFDMPVQKVVSSDRVVDNRSQICLQRGPLVYCAEWIDQPDEMVGNKYVSADMKFKTRYQNDKLGGIVELYSEDNDLILVPYYAWANRGEGPMRTWLPFKDQ